MKDLQELIKDVPQQPEILVGDEGAVEVARHPEVDAVITGQQMVNMCHDVLGKMGHGSLAPCACLRGGAGEPLPTRKSQACTTLTQ